jgi:hypothetical protein
MTATDDRAIGEDNRQNACDEADSLATSRDRLIELSDDDRWDVRMCVASNPRTPIDTLHTLGKDAYPEVRECVAANPSADTADIVWLAGDPDYIVRSYTAGNPRLPQELFDEMVRDSNPEIRASVGICERLTKDQYEALALDEDAEVRHSIATNPCTPPHVLAWFTYEVDKEVLLEALKHPDMPAEALEEAGDRYLGLGNEAYALAIANNPSCPAEIALWVLSPEPEDLVAYLEEGSLSPRVIEFLLQHESPLIREIAWQELNL